MMDFTKTRMFLIITLVFLGGALYSHWEQENGSLTQAASTTIVPEHYEIPSAQSPTSNNPLPAATVVSSLSSETSSHKNSRLIHVDTNVLHLEIDPEGGDIVFADLKQYPIDKNGHQGISLLNTTSKRYSVAQSGLVGDRGPDSRNKGRVLFQSKKTAYQMNDNENTISIPLSWKSSDGLEIEKVFTLHRDQYLVDVHYDVHNHSNIEWKGHFYAQIMGKPETFQKTGGMLSMQTYTGAAFYTKDKPYKKISFDKIQEKNFDQNVVGGWAAIVEHYFVTAWVFPEQQSNQYFTHTDTEGKIFLGAVGPTVTVSPHEHQKTGASLYVGPEITDSLKKIAPGLDLTVDYGFLWPISQFLFWMMQTIYAFLGNWGASIIVVTLMIKLVFYKLSASSYQSMAKMRKVQPKIVALKELHGDDKQQFSQAMMDLYRKEKVNPLGGCLPILVQIPVFIGLYYVLLESVELRHAPFMLWIQDLSSKDPFYVLPILMGITMLIQQKLNPAPADPIQAKVMMIMPVIFTVLFLQFPSGLVLYWFVNNLLSILQQWVITMRVENG